MSRLDHPGPPAQRRRNVPEVVQEVVDRVHADLAGAPFDEVLGALLQQLQSALPGVTFNEEGLYDYVVAISGARPGPEPA